MNRKESGFIKWGVRSLMIGSLGFLVVGCASEQTLERINREQSTTIASMNDEISRLNSDLGMQSIPIQYK